MSEDINLYVDIGIPVLTSVLAGTVSYFLGKRSLKKQFVLKYFDLHKEVLEKIISISKDEIDGYIFNLKNKELEKMAKGKVLSFREYFSDYGKIKLYEEAGFGMFAPPLLFSDVTELIGMIRSLEEGSNEKNNKQMKKILSIWNDKKDELSRDVDNFYESFDCNLEGCDISEEERRYINYYKRKKEELLLYEIIPLIKKLKIGLEKFLENKE